MNEGVQILIERVKTHPEEFVFEEQNPFKDSKWRNLIQHYKDYLPKEDVEALQGAINQVIQEKFTAKVMEELLDPKVEEQLTLNPYSTSTGNVILGGGTTHARSSVAVNNVNAVHNGGLTLTNAGTGLTWASSVNSTSPAVNNQLHELLHMKAQLDLEKQKKRETLYGRLKNYLGADA
jgi:hypothetical protein